jgi:hypothetical protein
VALRSNDGEAEVPSSIADLPVFEHTFWKKEQELSGKDGLSKK